MIGPFEDAPAPVGDGQGDRLQGHHEGRKGKPTWKPVRPEGTGLDLGAIYSRTTTNPPSASRNDEPVEGEGRLIVGSDDSLDVWINGKHVYGFDRTLGSGTEQGRPMSIAGGPNRLFMRCGNGNGEWMFSVSSAAERPSPTSASPI